MNAAPVVIPSAHPQPISSLKNKLHSKAHKYPAADFENQRCYGAFWLHFKPNSARAHLANCDGCFGWCNAFVVAGIEFSKRIVAQNKCNVCKGSGLVLRDNKYYFRCPACGTWVFAMTTMEKILHWLK